MTGFRPNATARGRLATEVEAAFTDEWGHVGGVAASGRRWRVAYAAADRVLAAGLAVDDAPPDGLTVGAAVHGYAGGAFGRDSYACRVVEAIGPDWIVTRNTRRETEAVTGERVEWVAEHADDRSWCDDECAPAAPASGADECPDHGPRIAVLASGYRFCAWCGWEPETGVIPTNPERP